MSTRSCTRPCAAAALAVALLFVSACLLAACTPGSGTGGGASDTPPAPTTPPPWQLRSPDTAVVSYLYWISFAYRISNSNVASQTFTPYEEVRVNSYVQLNNERGRRIEQKATNLKIKSVSVDGSTATVAAHEEWSYRYISLKTGKYTGPAHTAAYESTYTVVQDQQGLWRVEAVEASATTKVP